MKIRKYAIIATAIVTAMTAGTTIPKNAMAEDVPLATTAPSEETTSVSNHLGDVNGEGDDDSKKIDSEDASEILNYYSNKLVGKKYSPNNCDFSTDVADINKDGKVNAADASCILVYYAEVLLNGSSDIDKFNAPEKSNVSGISINVGDIEAKPGSAVSVPISVSGLDVKSFSYSGIKFKFDSALEYYDIAKGLVYDPTVAVNGNSIGVSSASSRDTSDNGTLYSLQFTVPSDAKEGTKYDISIDDLDLLGNSDKEYTNVKTTSGSITVKSKTSSDTDTGCSVQVGNAFGKAGETVNVPLIISGVNSDGINGISLKCNFDKKLTYSSISSSYSTTSTASDDAFSMIINTSEPFYGGVLCDVQFTIPKDAKIGTTYEIAPTSATIHGTKEYYSNITYTFGTIGVTGNEETKPTKSSEKTTTTVTTAADRILTLDGIKMNLSKTDVNEDGQIDSSDATLILIYYANKLLGKVD